MNIAALNVKIGADIADFNKNIAAVSTKLNSLSNDFKRVQDKFSGFANAGRGMQEVGSALTLGVTLPILALGAASIKSFGDIQALKKGLEAVTGSSEEAEKQFKRLRVVAKLPGLGLEEAIKGTINLQTIGFSAERAEQAMQGLGNAVATVGKGKAEFERAIYGLQQLANTEFPLGEDLNILKDAIPQITPLLKEAFGTARTEDLQKLGITSEQVVNTILSGLSKLPPVASGINNSFENMGDTIKNSLGTIGEDLNRAFDIEGILDKIAGLVEKASNAFVNLSPAVKITIYVVTGLVAAIGPLMAIFGTLLVALPSLIAGFAVFKATVIPALGAFVAAALPIIAVVAVIAALSAAIYGIVKSADLFGAAFKRVWVEAKQYVNDSILSMLSTIQEFGEGLNIDLGLGKAVEQAKEYQREISKQLSVTPDVSFKDAEDKMRKSVIDLFTNTKDKLKEEFTSLTDTTTKEVEKINTVLGGIGQGVSNVKELVIPVKFEADTSGLNEIKDLKFEGLKFDGSGLEELVNVQNQFEIATQKGLAFGSSFDVIGEKANILKASIGSLLENGFAATSGAVVALQEQLNQLPASMDELASKAIDVGAIFKSAMVGALTSFGQALGAIASGTGTGKAFDKILSIVASFIGDFGKMLIAAGVASKAFQELLISQPVAAIAAGVALVAISSAISGHLSKGVSSGGGGGGSTGTQYSAPSAAYEQQSLTARVEGSDLIFVLEKAQSKEGRING